MESNNKKKKKRCCLHSCNKKLDIATLEISLCKLCNKNYCLSHRLPENHVHECVQKCNKRTNEKLVDCNFIKIQKI